MTGRRNLPTGRAGLGPDVLQIDRSEFEPADVGRNPGCTELHEAVDTQVVRGPEKVREILRPEPVYQGGVGPIVDAIF